VIIPTGNERLLSGTPYPEFKFKFEAKTAEGASTLGNEHVIQVIKNCAG
jgi:hypothetical protein